MRLLEPRIKHAVFSNSIHHSVGADNRGVDGARKNQNTDDDDKGVEGKPQQLRSSEVHGETAKKVLNVILSNLIGNDHRGEQDNSAGGNCGVYADNVAGNFETLQLRMFDLTVNLRERFKTAHRKHG